MEKLSIRTLIFTLFSNIMSIRDWRWSHFIIYIYVKFNKQTSSDTIHRLDDE